MFSRPPIRAAVALTGLAALGATLVAGAAPAAAARTTAAHSAVPTLAAARLPLPAPAASGPTAASLARAALSPRMATLTTAPAPATFTVEGHGDGHGRGMGQYGAFGYASEAGYDWSAAQILAHYYQGTTLEPLAPWVENGRVKVNLSELDAATTTPVRAASPGAGFRVNGGRVLYGTHAIRHLGNLRTLRSTGGDLSVLLPGVGWRSYKGVIQIQPDGQTWNIVPVEAYVAGVVPAESIAGWGAMGGEAALQAQAVAARSYALAYIAAVGYTCDISACQNYEGDPTTNTSLGAMVDYTNVATTSTAGEVMCTVVAPSCRLSQVAFTEFSASTGGWTSGGTFPAVVDQGDAVASNPVHDWTVQLTAAQIESAFPAIGTPTALAVTARNGLGAWGGRATSVLLTGTKGTVSLTGDQFEGYFGLDSDWFTFVQPATIVAGARR